MLLNFVLASKICRLKHMLWFERFFQMFCVSCATCLRWHAAFLKGKESVDDEARGERPTTALSKVMINTTSFIIREDRLMTVHELGISKSSAHVILVKSIVALGPSPSHIFPIGVPRHCLWGIIGALCKWWSGFHGQYYHGKRIVDVPLRLLNETSKLTMPTPTTPPPNKARSVSQVIIFFFLLWRIYLPGSNVFAHHCNFQYIAVLKIMLYRFRLKRQQRKFKIFCWITTIHVRMWLRQFTNF